jgi:hypothetical protein
VVSKKCPEEQHTISSSSVADGELLCQVRSEQNTCRMRTKYPVQACPGREHQNDIYRKPLDVPESTAKLPRWVYVVGFHTFGLVLLFLIAHLIDGGLESN